MTKPLELLGGLPHDTHRVHFNSDHMKSHQITAKLQAVSLSPFVTQVVVDAITDLAVTGRPRIADGIGLKSKPIAYMQFGVENQTEALKFVVLSFVDYLLVATGGRMITKEALALEVGEVAKQLKEEIAHATFTAMEQIAKAREGLLAAPSEV